jgi:RimJ/RimL family protein N-acetyltransferase
MIFISESGLLDPGRIADWDEWYLGHLAAMVGVPGVSSAQRFRALDPGPPPSLALYTVLSPAVFEGEVYRSARGMGPFVSVVDESRHRRNLFDGLDSAPEVAPDAVLAVLDRDAPEPLSRITWLRAVGLDRSTAYRGIAVLPDLEAARRLATATGGATALYLPMTGRFRASGTPRVNEFGQGIGFPVEGWSARPRPPKTPIEGRFCRIEPLDAGRHAAQLFAANREDRDGRNFTYFNYGPFATLAEYRGWVETAAACDDPMAHAIVDAARGAAAGVCNYANIQPAIGAIEIAGLVFSPLLQRHPAATEAMYLMMRRAFDELGYRRYEWKCHALNLPSRAAAARLGFQYEGLFRQATITRGHNRDTAWFSIIDGEWPAVRAALEAWLDPSNFDGEGKQRRSLATLRQAFLG